MSRSLKLYLEDISTSIYKIKKNTKAISKQRFIEDDTIYDSVILNLQIIGESSKNIPSEIRDRYTQIEWRKIIGLRNIIAHTYFTLEPDVIWDIIQTKIDPLQTAIEQIQTDETTN
jgi:uncharacterized protein with HEPN domain